MQPCAIRTGLRRLQGRDVIGIAKTGSGKTAAYVWPMIGHVLDQRRTYGPVDSPVANLLLGTSTLRVLEQGVQDLPLADGLRIAVSSLERAVSLEPSYAEAWAALAHARLVGGGAAAEALRASRRAFALAPDRWHYRLLEAQALVQHDQLDAARRLLDEIIERDAGTLLADRAGEVLGRIGALESARQRH